MNLEREIQEIKKMVTEIHRQIVPKPQVVEKMIELLRAGDVRGARRLRDRKDRKGAK